MYHLYVNVLVIGTNCENKLYELVVTINCMCKLYEPVVYTSCLY